jgi:hypothetical protein
VYPGIKDLPAHIREHFRDEFIRFVVKQIANSKFPWTNPDVDSLQASFNIVYPTFPGRIRHSDAVHHPVSGLVFIVPSNTNVVPRPLRHLGCSAIVSPLPPLMPFEHTFLLCFAGRDSTRLREGLTMSTNSFDRTRIIQSSGESSLRVILRIIPRLVDTRRYATLRARASLPKRSLQIRRGLFQSDPILGTLKAYYSSSGIMEEPPLSDPGAGERPMGVLALASAAVRLSWPHQYYLSNPILC